MKCHGIVVAALAVCLPVAITAWAQGTDKPDMKASLALAQKYDQYTHPQAEGTWEKGDLLPTAKKEDADAWSVEGGTITIDNHGMTLQGQGNTGCYVTLAKKTFKGPIGIRYEAMTPEGAAPCDLSVRFGPADSAKAVGFAFGGYANNQDFFTFDKTHKELENGPLIKPGQWYTVECLLTADSVIAKVDGKTIGEEKTPSPVGADTEHDIALYVWGATGVFRNVQLMTCVPPKSDARSWEEVMGKTTKDDLKALAGKTGPLLGSDDYPTREAAQEILYALRPLSDDAVREQLKSTDAEAKMRAENLGRRMGLIKEDAKPEAPKPDVPDAQPQADLPGGRLIQLRK